MVTGITRATMGPTDSTPAQQPVPLTAMGVTDSQATSQWPQMFLTATGPTDIHRQGQLPWVPWTATGPTESYS